MENLKIPGNVPGSPGRRLRGVLAGGTVATPGIYDAISARVVEQQGYPLAYISGYAMSASYGYPDIGLLTQSEIVEASARIARAVDIPVIADADTGYGSALNVIRTVQLFESAGVAGIQLEDQVSPKRCGAMSGSSLIPVSEMQAKIHAAKEAQTDRDFVIIARTDANLIHGFPEALSRLKAYENAGADVLFFQMPTSLEQIGECADVLGAPLMITSSESLVVDTPLLTVPQYAEMGVALVVYAASMVLAAGAAMADVASDIHKAGTNAHILDRVWSFSDMNRRAGLDDWRSAEAEITNRWPETHNN